ncbi:MAG: polysaccharide pyruvyl transferase family protein [Propionibacteriales bacterium]|nr:polysaccharide pyruvyl transferase family protein [Propionibacteriales bacterium]
MDPQTWFDLLRGYQFSFGTRIHGNIAAILAGTPAMLLAHDSRTLELARYHEIPRRSVRKLPPDVRAADLYEQVDYTAFNAGHRARWEQFAAFLIRNGLPHVYEPGEDPSAFDARMAVTDFPAPVGVTSRAQAWMNRLRTDSPVRRLARRMLQRSDDQQPPPRGP